MSVAVHYWEVVKLPDGSDMSWDGEITFDLEKVPDFLRPYLEPRIMKVPLAVLQQKDFDPYEYYSALHPDRDNHGRQTRRYKP